MLDSLTKRLSPLPFWVNLIGVILLALFFLLRNPSSKWDKTIGGDGKSYYAYLTTAFIYHDLDYKFIESYEAKYYPPDQSLFKEFRQEFKGEITNKTFPGIAILWLPFFLIAHFLSYLSGFDPDGYSLLYQYSIGISAVFYVWLGLKWLSALLLSLEFKRNAIKLTLISLVFGTNLFFYTIYDPSLTHVYNFSMLAGILYFTRRFYLENKSKWILIAISLFSIAIITRPTNILMILFLPFALGNIADFKSFLRLIFANKKRLLIIIIIALAIGLIPIIWWFIQTGNLIVYSYGEETFNFSNPHLFQILFSYEKGWLLYSPLILLSIFGIIYYFKKNRFLFLIGMVSFISIAYIFSCWWIWTYGASFGQRVFVDFYAIIGILLVAGFTLLQHHKLTTILWFVIAFSFIGLNQLQTYQFKNGILPSTGVTKAIYWDSYFKLKAIRKSHPIGKLYEVIKQYQTDFESDAKWITITTKTDTKANSGQFSQQISADSPYSGGLKEKIPLGADFIQVSVNIYCESNSASPELVYELATNINNSIYNSKGLMPYLRKNRWTKFYCTIELEDKSRKDFTTYFYNPTNDKIWIDDLEITFGRYK
ncbi:MAG: hypothetical protein AB8B74_05595 [Crocinitomicaceae bacterium]